MESLIPGKNRACSAGAFTPCVVAKKMENVKPPRLEPANAPVELEQLFVLETTTALTGALIIN